MHLHSLSLVLGIILSAVSFVFGLGTSCTSPLGAGTAAAGDPYWLETIKHQGLAAYNSNPGGYQVFRNVKNFGAKGDGVTDDTAAINAAITAGNRCGGGSCHSSTITPAIVYFPRGTYLVSAPIIAYYYTQLIGDAKAPPTLLAASSFNGIAVIDADPYIPGGGGAQYYTNQNNFNGKLAGSIVINNAKLNNVPTAVGVVGGAVVLAGGTTTISSWGQGNVYTGTNSAARFTQGSIHAANKPSVLLDSSGKIFGKTHPQYAAYAVSQFVSVKDNGAKGDGRTDDTLALKAIFSKFAGCKIIFFDAGTYIVSSTITIPAGTQIVGEAWSVIAGSGSAFKDQASPQVVVKVGDTNSQGLVEITDMLFTTVGPAAGAIVVEWNVKQPAGQNGGAGMWDTHIRLGGAAGTNLEASQCPSSGSGGFTNCFAAFLALHLTPASTAYLEGAWVWLADHDLDGDGSSQISLYSGRGILSESAGPVWMIGTAEHHVLYQYSLVNARNHYMGLIQTESPYYQPNPAPPAPFTVNSAFKDPTFSVFRNVKDFGAKGDGITDDTEAINLAISSGGRCGGGSSACNSSTITPALVYFPKGVYLISTPIIAYYYTQLVGDAKFPPTLLASANFEGLAVIDANPYIPGGGGAQFYTATTNFFRSVRNFVIDVRRVPAERSQGTGLHWQVAQATSLVNLVFEMSAAPGTAHQGIWMENGSGGYMGDLVFNGGKFGMWVGNQQYVITTLDAPSIDILHRFTVRNVTFNNVDTAVLNHWNWGWSFQGVMINNCKVGFDLLQGVSAVAIVDAVVRDTPVFIRSAAASRASLSGSLALSNILLKDVPTAVGDANGASALPGGAHVVIESWGQGNVYSGTDPTGEFKQGPIAAAHKPSVLLDSAGRIFGKKHPQYEDYSVREFVSVKDHGARGDGSTDDTRAIQTMFNKFAGRKIIFFNAGTYIVTSTITLPPGTRMVGEAWSVIAGKGNAFADQENPQVVIRVGEKHSRGVVEITDMIFSTVGPAPGAIVVEWNIREPNGHQGAAGMWNTHIRLGGAAGTELELANCPLGATDTEPCMAAFLALHLTHGSSAYLEGTWVWLADHILDGQGSSQISIYSGRGILSESEGPVWMLVTEHHVLYQYRLVHAKNHYMGLIQTESPYWQPSPAAPEPFSLDSAYKDPMFSETDTFSWALSIELSKDIIVFGAGLYSFFQNYSQACLDARNCQPQIIDIDSESVVHIYSLSTVASAFQVSVDGVGIVEESDNVNGFASTVTVWSSSGKSRHGGDQVHAEIGI
ncbi:hypothetical protein D9615_001631 [Tricholomella constricta]|uniref:Rhamnogalacturonase A/B/Epimerase-like pectate lyase domain-containing protein n=1 Tax=Tricholomella constricta TaxID=117010 RepID=A0A8H5HPL8_9AGAR|nr:hypothetical protein D9615_001631 [Tricholomella constricta]